MTDTHPRPGHARLETFSWVLSSLALTGGAALWTAALGPRADAWAALGGTLGLDQRHFRVHDNFVDPTARDNVTPDANFPGALGPVMAIWKASCEWGSEKHGNGMGDPYQFTGLGSGGANFDFSYQGTSPGVGGVNDNVHSALAGGAGGVLAFTETPIADGWRIRYYESWSWEDGPGTYVAFTEMDLQGVATHEIGHALGLGHSALAGTTMYAAIAGSGLAQRSIASDDKAGVQGLYGVKSPAKPRITGASVFGGQLLLTGVNFAPFGGEVWFTGTSGAGQPLKVSGVSSPDGATISLPIPAGAGPGDVLVRGAGTGPADLSNAWPSDLQESYPAPTVFCATTPNSVGAGALVSWLGSTSVAAADLRLRATGCPNQQFGVFYYGPTQVALPFGNGLRCVGGSLTRLPIQNTGASGIAELALDFSAPAQAAGPAALLPGRLWNFQFWYRDPAAGGAGFNLSNGLQVAFGQ